MSLKNFHHLGKRFMLWQYPIITATMKHATLHTQTHPAMIHMAKISCRRQILSSNYNAQRMCINWRMYTEGSDDHFDEGNAETSKMLTRGLLSKRKRRDLVEAETHFMQMIDEKGKPAWTLEDWSEACEILTQLLRSPWDIMCMKILRHESNLDMAQSLMVYLESQPKPVSRVTMSHYIALLGSMSAGSVEQGDLMKEYYTKFIDENDLLDTRTIELLVAGLSHTHHYPECLWLLEKCLENEYPGATLLVNILKAGLRFHDVQVCEQAIETFVQGHEITQLERFVPEIVKVCFDAQNESGLELVVKHLERHGLLLGREYLDEITQHFKRYQPGMWTGRYSYIHNRGGNCVECDHQMPRNNVTDEEFRDLRDSFFNQVIVGSNVFFRSSPKEVERFCQFVSKQGPFDVVIDGLNVQYKGPKMDNQKMQQRLLKAVTYFTSHGNRVLVLGSMSLKPNLPRLLSISPSPLVYLTTTTRADDVFFLYAALYSGKTTTIVSHDKLRDHCFTLERRLRTVFNTWLQTVQIYDWFFARTGGFGIKPVRSFKLGPSRDPGGWHFPLNDHTDVDPFGRMSVLCLRKSKSALPRIGRPRTQTKKYYQQKEREKQEQKKTEQEWFQL